MDIIADPTVDRSYDQTTRHEHAKDVVCPACSEPNRESQDAGPATPPPPVVTNCEHDLPPHYCNVCLSAKALQNAFQPPVFSGGDAAEAFRPAAVVGGTGRAADAWKSLRAENETLKSENAALLALATQRQTIIEIAHRRLAGFERITATLADKLDELQAMLGRPEFKAVIAADDAIRTKGTDDRTGREQRYDEAAA